MKRKRICRIVEGEKYPGPLFWVSWGERGSGNWANASHMALLYRYRPCFYMRLYKAFCNNCDIATVVAYWIVRNPAAASLLSIMHWVRLLHHDVRHWFKRSKLELKLSRESEAASSFGVISFSLSRLTNNHESSASRSNFILSSLSWNIKSQFSMKHVLY